ncbi:Hypothetical predicted protein, partial [Lynx pardinus]
MDICIHFRKANLSLGRTRFASSVRGRTRRGASGRAQQLFARHSGGALSAPHPGPAPSSAIGRSPAQPPDPPGRPLGRAGAAPYADEEGVASAQRLGPGSAERPGIKKVVKTFPRTTAKAPET